MEYHEAANFLFDLRRFRMKPGIEAVRGLLEHLDDPHDDVAFVQVAGSNGKGSTARMVASLLRESELSVGLYTSPHLDSLRERVTVDGRRIPKRAVCEFVERARPYLVDRAAAGEPLTFFETLTALALWQFDRADVDVAVLEVGMGGELDATSVVDPVASAVTNVTLEHTQVLGDTVEEIATTKAAVAPADGPLVTAATGAALTTIREQVPEVVHVGDAGAHDGDDADGDPDVTTTYHGHGHGHGQGSTLEARVTVAGDGWRVDSPLALLGAHQAQNAGVAVVLARQVADRFGVDLTEPMVVRGLRGAHWPGRFEVLSRDPLVVLDGAHNPGACEQVTSVLGGFDYDRLHLVFGAMHDKDHRGMVEALPTPDSVVTCRPNVDRAETPEILARVFESAGAADVTAGDTVASAVETARHRADPEDCVLVTGSLTCVGEARTTWTRRVVEKRVRTPDEADAVFAHASVPAPAAREARTDAVHRVVETRVARRQAAVVQREMTRVGGDCVVSGHEADGELVSLVVMGTLAEFSVLVDALEDAPYGLGDVRERLRSRLDLGTGEASTEPTAGSADYPWSERTAVMGVLNVTPDSFHDGGEYHDVDDAVDQAEAMVDAGVDIVDVGGESTRPGAEPVPASEEIDRIVPVIEAIASLDTLVSVDTRKAAVAEAALDAGADIINDVTGLDDPEMRFLVAERDAPVVVMHSIDAPVDPENVVEYDDVVGDVVAELTETVLRAESAGIPRENVIVDPGIGFGKRPGENFTLIDRVDEFHALGCPVLVGHSHKSMFGLVGCDADERGPATVAATALAADRGADIVRVHDVPENVAAVRVAQAMRERRDESF
ncbi:dihydropteroate synthase [Salinigranum sp.]|uniref:dihydropteroate synthase n=1 Tax=Salinigranum sp. TaxID=1966351 RepID=UPI003567CF49